MSQGFVNSHEMFYSPNMVRDLQLEAMGLSSPAEYVDFLQAGYRTEGPEAYTTVLCAAARYVKPEDPVLVEAGIETSEAQAASEAFTKGGVLAMRVAENCGGAAVMAEMTHVPLPAPTVLETSRDLDVVTQVIAHVIMHVGQEEYREAEPFHDLLGRWIDTIVPDVRSQFFFLTGFGLVAYHGRRAVELVDIKKTTRAFSDADFNKLLGIE